MPRVEAKQNTDRTIKKELRTAWRMTQPADMYSHMEPQLRSLTREEDTMRTRKILPGEQVKSLWDVVTSEDVEFRLFSTSGSFTSFTPQGAGTGEMADSPYLFYTKANAVEDEILFPDELTSNKKNVHFREIRNPVSRLEHSGLPGHNKYWEKGLTAILAGEDFKEPLSKEMDTDDDSMWALPAIWKSGLEKLLQGTLSAEQREVLEETGLDAIKEGQLIADRLDSADPMEVMERERSTGEYTYAVLCWPFCFRIKSLTFSCQSSKRRFTMETLSRDVPKGIGKSKKLSRLCSKLLMRNHLIGFIISPS